MIKTVISQLLKKKNLNFQQAKELFDEILSSSLTPSQIAAVLLLLKAKGEASDEIFAAAMSIREKAIKINPRDNFFGVEDRQQQIMDTCGTGGFGLNKFNVSTATAFVVSGAGIKVAKHGNRAMSSHHGSADVLEALGINITAEPVIMEKAIRNIGIGFLYAPLYHPALAKVAQIRKELGVRTIFNILGPLCNPAFANYQLLGTYSYSLAKTLVLVLKKLGLKKAFVVYSKDTGDEISLSGPTEVFFLNNKKISNFTLKPLDFGLKKIAIKDIIVKDLKTSAKMVKDILKGKKDPARSIVLANASACFYLLGKVSNFKQGVKLAKEVIDSKKAQEKFLQLKEFLNKNA